MKFTKYSISRIICCFIITIILFNNGLEINTWQFWAVYLSAQAMTLFQYLEDSNR